MFSRLLHTALFLIYSAWLSAQNPQLIFSRLNIQDGLSHNKVNCILQDKRGFIWMGTEDGLNRFDGKYFTLFRNTPGNTTTISGNIITSLLEDEEGVLWIGSADAGLTRYDHRLPAAQQFRQYRHVPKDSSSIPINIINAITQDHAGYLWLATGGNRVLRFSKQTGTFDEPVKEGTRYALSLVMDNSDTLWVGRQGGGMLKVNTHDLKYNMDRRYSDLYADLPHASVSSLYKDKQGNIWFGSWDKILYRFDMQLKQEQAFTTPADEILSFAEDTTGTIWMGGKSKGLFIYDKEKNSFTNLRYDPALEGTIIDDRINCIYVGRDGMVWLGTNRGVSIYNPSQQPFSQQFLDKNGKDLKIYDLQSVNGDQWVGTSDGLYIRIKGATTFRHVPLQYKGHPLAVSKIFRDDDGTLYLGTNFTLFICDPENFTLSLLPNTEKDPVIYNIIDSRIVSIIKDTIANHPVLITVPYGHFIAYYDFVTQRWTSREDTTMNIIKRFNLSDHLIRKLYKTPLGNIWMATAKAGLGEWKKDSWPYVEYHSALSNNNVYDMAEDPSGKLWVSTYGGGLNHFDPQTDTFTHIAASSNLLEGLQLDGWQNVWMVSNGHLHKYDPYIETYSTYQLPDLEKSGGVSGSIFKDTDGQMYVAGNNYVVAFRPEKIREERKYPKVFFTDFLIFNASYSERLKEKEIRLPHNKNYFTFTFSAPEFMQRNTIYAYMLEGFDKDWIEAGDRNYASYSNLDGGYYTLKVKASSSKGNWGNEYAAIRIRIIPPFWKAWWFFLLCAATIAATTYAIYRYRINELLDRQAIRNKIAQDLHDNVGSTLSSIGVYSEVAQIYLQQQKNTDLKSTLEKIRDACGEMISELSDTVWTINPRNDHMSTILQRMDSFARPLLKAQDVDFHMNFDIDITRLNLEMTKRKNFYLIFKEAVSNAYKYAQCKNLWVDVKEGQHFLQLIVRDDGQGFDPGRVKSANTLSGNGLRNMQRRAKEMKGECVISSIPGEGTTLTLRFPIP
ncbi:histidine kinase [Chitinophaga sp. SYP-B3965]|uniref:sensor histidine kinase n=1 Tax=Chitinophaga sp. SYP-B3965 TaxID=2663120 RepID=UPI0012999232|nr:two-component regulator propeller domain-containing protein [Chitinophaga sp. SYP-B3965]MRG48358.1 histidine kinase [Chitinophaga sp. SYP-B3965]